MIFCTLSKREARTTPLQDLGFSFRITINQFLTMAIISLYLFENFLIEFFDSLEWLITSKTLNLSDGVRRTIYKRKETRTDAHQKC